jgi:calcineurin-like phosphoesterase family protein
MATFFTSDTHFGDRRALRIDRRPFPSLNEHDAALVRFWNEVVSPADEVWHLGDFALGPPADRVQEILASLNGSKHLLIGNNDGPGTLAAAGWASTQHYAEITLDGVHLVMCHYPLRTWNGIGRGVIDFHGHSHGKLKPLQRQFDVGVDVFGYRPVDLQTILASRRRRSKVKP